MRSFRKPRSNVWICFLFHTRKNRNVVQVDEVALPAVPIADPESTEREESLPQEQTAGFHCLLTIHW